MKDHRLAVLCELDAELGRDGSAMIWPTISELQPEDETDATLPTWDALATSGQSPRGGVLLVNSEGELVQKLAASNEKFCNAFPNAFFYVNSKRGLAAGFHLVEGFYRDDRPLVEKVLSDQQNAELDRLWEELNFVTNSTETLLRGFVWFERSERHVLQDERFDFLRAEDPETCQR